MRIKLILNYDGTAFNGWQKQPNGVTVQQTVEDAVFALTGKTVSVTGSGRTDAGVHAKGQVAHFDIDGCTIPPENFAKALNTKLPADVKIAKSELADDNFNACRSAKKKTYGYSFYYSETPLPLKERYAERLDYAPDFSAICKAKELFVGEHDFKAFCASGSTAKTTVRTVYSVEIEDNADGFTVKISGNGFLYNMVRIIVGVLLDIGYGRKTVDDIVYALNSGKRDILGKTLPAKGLCLESVEYE